MSELELFEKLCQIKELPYKEGLVVIDEALNTAWQEGYDAKEREVREL